ncbi:MAG TPA: hypothetical protein DCX27_14385, partial [Balneola sp.]|nr:hypothetical protein [Balneola sp.]
HDATGENLAGEKTCSYMVYWLNNGKSKGKKSKMFKTTIENDFSLIVQFDEDGKPFLFEDV